MVAVAPEATPELARLCLWIWLFLLFVTITGSCVSVSLAFTMGWQWYSGFAVLCNSLGFIAALLLRRIMPRARKIIHQDLPPVVVHELTARGIGRFSVVRRASEGFSIDPQAEYSLALYDVEGHRWAEVGRGDVHVYWHDQHEGDSTLLRFVAQRPIQFNFWGVLRRGEIVGAVKLPYRQELKQNERYTLKLSLRR